MTTSTLESPALAPAIRSPAMVIGLTVMSAAAGLVQSAISAIELFRAFDAAAWHAGVILLHAAAVIGLPILAVLAILAVRSGGGLPAAAYARLLRFAIYTAVITSFTTFNFEPQVLDSHGWLPRVLWLVRCLVAVGLPVGLFLCLRVSQRVLSTFGKSFGSQVVDAGVLMIARDGAISVLVMLLALLTVLLHASMPSIRNFGWHFLVTRDWRPNALVVQTPKHDADGNVIIEDGEVAMDTQTTPPSFGALPVIWGTAVSSALAVIVAVPLSFGAAMFLVRVAPRGLVAPVSFLIEFLAAIPSIAYGIWGLFVLGPFLQRRFEPNVLALYMHTPSMSWVLLVLTLLAVAAGIAIPILFGRYGASAGRPTLAWAVLGGDVVTTVVVLWLLFHLAYGSVPVLPGVESSVRSVLGNPPTLAWLFHDTVQVGGQTVVRPVALTGNDMLCGGLILAVMIIPIITAISRDILRAVPRAQVEGTAALGATWWQSSREMLRYSRSGLFGAAMLGLARAAGETMAITMVIGNNSQIKFSPFMAAQTMSSLLANEFAEADTALHRSALFEVALILLVMSLAFNVVARYLVVGKNARTAAAF